MGYIIKTGGAGTSANYASSNHVQVSVDLSNATWNTVASHEVFTITGLVRMKLWIECTENVAGAGAIQFGVEGATNAFIASTTGTDLDANDLWYDATPTVVYDISQYVIMDYVVNGLDVGYEITGAALTDGTLVFHCVWEPLNSTGAVVAGAGGSLT